MPGSETIVIATIWGLLLCGLFFALRGRLRRARRRRADSKTLPPSLP